MTFRSAAPGPVPGEDEDEDEDEAVTCGPVGDGVIEGAPGHEQREEQRGGNGADHGGRVSARW